MIRIAPGAISSREGFFFFKTNKVARLKNGGRGRVHQNRRGERVGREINYFHQDFVIKQRVEPSNTNNNSNENNLNITNTSNEKNCA